VRCSTISPLRFRESCQVDEALAFVDGNGELVARWILFDQPYGIAGHIEASGHANEVGKRQTLNHRRPQRSVVGEVRVSAPILVTHKAVITDVVNVRRGLIRRSEGRPDGEGGTETRWFPDPSLNDSGGSACLGR
jgi:hypothetical protein